jgi:hypothetical protein
MRKGQGTAFKWNISVVIFQTLLNIITWPEYCTITYFIGQYLQTFRIRTQRYFNSTQIIFIENDRICINIRHLFTIYRSLSSNDISVIEDNTFNNLPNYKLVFRINDISGEVSVEFEGHVCQQLVLYKNSITYDIHWHIRTIYLAQFAGKYIFCLFLFRLEKIK